MQLRREVLGDEHVDRAVREHERVHGGLPGPDHPLRVGRDLDAPRRRPAHAQRDHHHRARRPRPPRGARAARARGAPQRRSLPTRSRRCCCTVAIYCGVPAANARVRGRPAGARGGRPALMRTQVGIVGAGPAGLVLAHLLRLRGVESVVIEARDREYVQQRVRAGVLEQGTVDLLVEMGLGERLQREGLVHEGLELRFGGRGHRIALSDLTGGRAITIYGQQEVVKDLIDARQRGRVGHCCSRSSDVQRRRRHEPRIEFTPRRRASRRSSATSSPAATASTASRAASVPDGVLTEHEHVYPFAWLGILAQRARRRPRSSSTATTSAASHCTACARPSCRASTCRSTPTSDIERVAGRADLGGAAARASLWTTADGR